MNLNIQEYNDKTLSDHQPLFYNTNGFGKVLSWNILWKNYFNENFNFFNNGFGNLETESEYLNRLDRIISKITEFALEENLNIILLQEVPMISISESHYNYFIENLSLSLSSISNKKFIIDKNLYDAKGGNAIIYNNYSLTPNYLDRDLNNLTNQKLTIQKNKYHFASFKNSEGEVLDVINVHFKYPTDEIEKKFYIHDLNIIFNTNLEFHKTPHNLLIGGDFNQNLHELNLPENVDIHVVPNTTVVYNVKENHQFFDTADGFIYWS